MLWKSDWYAIYLSEGEVIFTHVLFQKYLIGAQMSLFGPDINDDSVVFNNYRVYGSILLFIMGTIVFFGVKIVNKFAGLALVCVLGSIVCIFVGILVNFNGNDKAK